MKLKTAELIGQALDYAVAVCEGGTFRMHTMRSYEPVTVPVMHWPNGYWVELCDLAYSSDWSLSGEIIEREEIELLKWAREGWEAKATNYSFLNTPQETDVFAEGHGPTPLVAAMRCYVASKLGDEVEIPDELL